MTRCLLPWRSLSLTFYVGWLHPLCLTETRSFLRQSVASRWTTAMLHVTMAKSRRGSALCLRTQVPLLMRLHYPIAMPAARGV